MLALGVALASQAHALRFSDIEVGSYLDQPLKARIEIKQATDAEVDSLIASLASKDAFDRAGIELTPELASITFTKGPNGSIYTSPRIPRFENRSCCF